MHLLTGSGWWGSPPALWPGGPGPGRPPAPSGPQSVWFSAPSAAARSGWGTSAPSPWPTSYRPYRHDEGRSDSRGLPRVDLCDPPGEILWGTLSSSFTFLCVYCSFKHESSDTLYQIKRTRHVGMQIHFGKKTSQVLNKKCTWATNATSQLLTPLVYATLRKQWAWGGGVCDLWGDPSHLPGGHQLLHLLQDGQGVTARQEALHTQRQSNLTLFIQRLIYNTRCFTVQWR